MQFPATSKPSSLGAPPPLRGLVSGPTTGPVRLASPLLPAMEQHSIICRGGTEAEPRRAEAGSRQAEEAALQPTHLQHHQKIRQQVRRRRRQRIQRRRRRQEVLGLPRRFRDEAVRHHHTLQPHVSRGMYRSLGEEPGEVPGLQVCHCRTCPASRWHHRPQGCPRGEKLYLLEIY